MPELEGKISKFFKIDGGLSGLSEEFAYNNQPQGKNDIVHVFSSSTDSKTSLKEISKFAKIDNKNIKMFHDEGILIARNGKAGTMRYINLKNYTMNDHAYILTVKKEYRDEINIKYVQYRLKNEIENCVTSDKKGNRTFNKTLFEQEYIYIPNIKEQNKEINEYEKIYKIYNFINFEKNKIEKILNKVPVTQIGNIYRIKDVFNIIPENHDFTEEYIYYHQGTYPVYSAQINGAYGYINTYNNKTSNDKELLFIIQYGDSGKTVLRKGKLNVGRNTCAIFPKNEFIDKINLRYMKYILQAEFINKKTGDGLQALSQGTIKDTEFFLPDIKEQNEIASEFEKIEFYYDELNKLKEKIEKIL